MRNRTAPKRHLFMSKNFILMLVMLVLIIMTVSAWFTFTKTVKANDMLVKATSSEIDIAPCVKTFNAETGAVETEGPGEFGSEVVFSFKSDLDYLTSDARSHFGAYSKDCTGDGMELIVPEFNVTKDYESVRKNSGKEVNVNLKPATATSNLDSEQYVREHPDQEAPPYQFLEFEFYVRSKTKRLCLQPETRIVAQTESDGHSLSYVPDDKKSSYGNFNVDALVGAIRVSLVGEACTSINQSWQYDSALGKNVISSTNVASKLTAERQLFWIPRPDVFLDLAHTVDNDVSNWPLETGVTSSQHNGVTYTATYYKENAAHNGVDYIENDTSAKVSSGTAMVGNVAVPSLGEAVNISDFSYSEQLTPVSLVVDKTDINVTADYYVTKYTMKVWIEGTDTEARRAMDGGRFSVYLSFS